jgi:hypothetical protein
MLKWDNVVFGDQEDSELGKQRFRGSLNPLSGSPDTDFKLSDAVVPKGKLKVITDDSKLPFADAIEREVDSIFSNRHALAKTDTKDFKNGLKAFEKGDREGLIKALSGLEFQVEQQRDRWGLIEQTRSKVESPENQRSVMAKAKGGFGFFGDGAGKTLAEETRKVNEVRRVVKESADVTKARAENLRAKLRRLDATVPRESSLPSEDAVVFSELKQRRSGLEEPVAFMVDQKDLWGLDKFKKDRWWK